MLFRRVCFPPTNTRARRTIDARASPARINRTARPERSSLLWLTTCPTSVRARSTLAFRAAAVSRPPRVIAHALFLSGHAVPSDAGGTGLDRDGPGTRATRERRSRTPRLRRCTRLSASIDSSARSDGRTRGDGGTPARGRFSAGAAAPSIVGGDRPSLGGDVLRPFRRRHRPPTDRGMPRSTRDRSVSFSPRRSRPRDGADPPRVPPDPRLPFCQRFLPKRSRGHALTFYFAFPLLFRARRTQL